MAYSDQAYIEQLSSGELLGFLNTCLWRDQWHQHTQTVPLVFAALQSRRVPIPEQIEAAWAHFLSTTETDIE